MQRLNIPRAILLTWLLICSTGVAIARAQSDIDFFESKIRPLLVTHCLKCHGDEKQESGLRLDSPLHWKKGGLSGPAIIPGKPQDSLLLRAVKKTDPDLQMPPGKTKLSPQEIVSLEQWIRAGAIAPSEPTPVPLSKLTLEQAEKFWSFQPAIRPMPPTSKSIDRWSWTPVDRFILKRLESEGLPPSPVADKRTLIRRATFDLTGLPPTPEEIHAFINDGQANAFNKVIDRLLDSHSYGERWGRHWLDVARYADTAGDGADYPVREAFKYRDWVINAFNADQPYNEFVREQIAGDIIASTGPESLYASRVTATGFLAIGKRYGYKPSPDYQHLDFADVIDSVGRSLLGLTVGCARCHDHKYDPITTEDYYALYGMMQSTTWAFPGGEEQKHPSHFPALVAPEKARQLDAERIAALDSFDRDRKALEKERQENSANWLAGGLDLGMESQELDKPLTAPWVYAGPVEIRGSSQSPFRNVHPQGTRGVHLGSGLNTDGIRYVFPNELKTNNSDTISFNLDFRTQADASQKGAYRFYLGQGVVQSLAVEFSVTPTSFVIRNGGEWENLRSLKTGEWYTLQVVINTQEKTYMGVVGTPGDLTRFSDKKTAPNWNGIVDCFICDAIGHVPGPASARDIDNVGLRQTPFAALNSPEVMPRIQTAADKKRILEIERKLAQLNELKTTVQATPVYEVAYGVQEGTPMDAHIQLRGEPTKLGRQVPRRFLEVFGAEQLPLGYIGSGRLQLADWITSPKNPLAARVLVNRVWQWHFGQGIVSTPSDFGFRGARPTHPELLNWLTAEFIASNWSIKHLHRVMMQSRVYQLSSINYSEKSQLDPSNSLHWRYTRRPLDAESMRDAMLAVSGNLKQSNGQPHPFPDVNTWGFTIHHPFHAVYQSNYRSVYLMQQRNRRNPYLELFDSADPNVSIGKRQPTVTPTQTLFLMNSKFVHEQARALAERILMSAKTTDQRVQLAFEIGHGRQPSKSDFEAAVEFVTTYNQESSRQNQPASQQEIWSGLARVILTSNSFLFVD
jgi:cytochrome c553